jgi:hypothetical protein
MKMGTGYARKFQTFVYQVENQFGELVISRREPGDFALNPNNFLFRKSFTVGYLNGGWSTVQPIDHSLPSDVGKNMEFKSIAELRVYHDANFDPKALEEILDPQRGTYNLGPSQTGKKLTLLFPASVLDILGIEDIATFYDAINNTAPGEFNHEVTMPTKLTRFTDGRVTVAGINYRGLTTSLDQATTISEVGSSIIRTSKSFQATTDQRLTALLSGLVHELAHKKRARYSV